MKNTFKASTKEITIGKGKLQLNKSTKEFRTKVQMFADGINAMNDKANYYRDCVNTAKRALELYNKGTYKNSAEIERMEAQIEAYKQAQSDIMAELREKMPEYSEADKNLFYAYRSYINGEEDAKSGNTYKRAFAEWLDEAGITPTEEGIKYIISHIGVKKATAKQMYKNGGTVFTSNMNEKPYLELVYRIIATLMYENKALKPFTYEYELKTKKDNK